MAGKGCTSGSMISRDNEGTNTSIDLIVKKPGAYYLAVSASAVRKSTASKERILSGWKLYTTTDKLPQKLYAGIDTTFYAMARYTGNDHGTAVALLTFALRSATGKTLTLTNGGTTVLSIPAIDSVSSGSGLLEVPDVKTAFSNTTYLSCYLNLPVLIYPRPFIVCI